jgi:hypothetical protein
MNFPASVKNLLLEEGTNFKDDYGENSQALGTGIIAIVGTARSGKTSLAYSMLEWVIDNTNRDIILDSFPQIIIDEAFPSKFEGRIFNHEFVDIASIEKSSVWLVDDTGSSFNSRDSMSGNSRTLSRVAGILSHWEQTVIFTTQLFSAVDLSFLRYTALVPILRRVDPSVISQERPQFQETVRHSNYQLLLVSQKPYMRDYYFNVKDGTVCESPYPDWINKEKNPVQADMLSKPMKYHDMKKKYEIIGQKPPNKSKKQEKMEN